MSLCDDAQWRPYKYQCMDVPIYSTLISLLRCDYRWSQGPCVLNNEVCKTWRRDFGVDGLTEESVREIAATGQAYLHSSPDVEGRPVVVVVAANLV